MVGRHAGIEESAQGEARVPHGRETRLHPERLAVLRREAPVLSEALQPLRDDRVVQPVPEGAQCDERVDPRRLYASPRAVRFLVADDPVHCGLERPLPPGDERQVAVDAERLVQEQESSLEGEGLRPPARQRERNRTFRVELHDPCALARRPRGMKREDDGHRHDRRARPTREAVDVEGRPLRQQHHVRGHGRRSLPVPLTEEGEPYLGEYARPGHPALRQDEGARPRHVGSIGRVAGEFEREVALDGRAQVSRRAVVHTPGAVLGLSAPDVFRDAGDAVALVRPHEVREHDVLRLHGRVGLQLSPPVAVLVLRTEEVVLRPLQRFAEAALHALFDQVRHRCGSELTSELREDALHGRLQGARRSARFQRQRKEAPGR